MRVMAAAILMATTLSALGGCATSPLSSWSTAEVVVRTPAATQPDRQAALDAYWRDTRAAQQRAREYDALHPAPPAPRPAADQAPPFEDGLSLRDRQGAREAAERQARVRAALGQ